MGNQISWFSIPTKTTKIGTPQIIVLSQYAKAYDMEKQTDGRTCITIIPLKWQAYNISKVSKSENIN